MPVIDFEDYTPSPRHDGQPWTQVRVEEASTSVGPWTVIDTIALSPLDANPAEPQSRSFTTDNATLVQGWYRVTFLDALTNTSNPSQPVQNVAAVDSNIRPTVADIGTLLRARTVDSVGVERGTFTNTTRPTAAEVEDYIDRAFDFVTLRIGDDIPDALQPKIRSVVALRAAYLVELSYQPEQTDNAQSAAAQYNALYLEMMAALEQALHHNQASETAPRMFSIPLHGRDGRHVINLPGDLQPWFDSDLIP